MEGSLSGFPRARDDNVIATEMPDGVLVYDLDREHRHFLNQTATIIWRHCDGRTSVTDLTSLLRRENLPADEDVVWLALHRLEKAHLLRDPLTGSSTAVSRRRVIQKLGLAAGLTVLLPMVTTVVAPTPAMAQSSDGGNTSTAEAVVAAASCQCTLRTASGRVYRSTGTTRGLCSSSVIAQCLAAESAAQCRSAPVVQLNC